MKSKLFLVFLMSILSVSLFAQMNISTNFRQDGIWDKEKEEWTLIAKYNIGNKKVDYDHRENETKDNE